MRGNSHVRFSGEGASATILPYPTGGTMSLTIETLLATLSDARVGIADLNCFDSGDAVYGVRSLFSPTEIRRSFASDESKVRFADDDCGNYFVVDRSDGSVWFSDHETDEIKHLARTLDEFLAALSKMPPVELKPGQVISAWIDPAFLSSLNDGKA